MVLDLASDSETISTTVAVACKRQEVAVASVYDRLSAELMRVDASICPEIPSSKADGRKVPSSQIE
jgi:hypothetical protein